MKSYIPAVCVFLVMGVIQWWSVIHYEGKITACKSECDALADDNKRLKAREIAIILKRRSETDSFKKVIQHERWQRLK